MTVCFDSKLVRLEEIASQEAKLKSILFRFQTGAIRSL